MWALSGGNLSREVEHFLLWELPLKRGNLYYHAALIANGTKTVAPKDSKMAVHEKFEKLLREKLKRERGAK